MEKIRLENCTVKMLIECLQALPQDMPVAVNYDIQSTKDGHWENYIEIFKVEFTDSNYPYDLPDMDYINIE